MDGVRSGLNLKLKTYVICVPKWNSRSRDRPSNFYAFSEWRLLKSSQPQNRTVNWLSVRNEGVSSNCEVLTKAQKLWKKHGVSPKAMDLLAKEPQAQIGGCMEAAVSRKPWAISKACFHVLRLESLRMVLIPVGRCCSKLCIIHASTLSNKSVDHSLIIQGKLASAAAGFASCLAKVGTNKGCGKIRLQGSVARCCQRRLSSQISATFLHHAMRAALRAM